MHRENFITIKLSYATRQFFFMSLKCYLPEKYWLEGFASKVHVSPFLYLIATLVALLIGWLSISYQTIKAANYNPAKALRIE